MSTSSDPARPQSGEKRSAFIVVGERERRGCRRLLAHHSLLRTHRAELPAAQQYPPRPPCPASLARSPRRRGPPSPPPALNPRLSSRAQPYQQHQQRLQPARLLPSSARAARGPSSPRCGPPSSPPPRPRPPPSRPSSPSSRPAARAQARSRSARPCTAPSTSRRRCAASASTGSSSARRPRRGAGRSRGGGARAASSSATERATRGVGPGAGWSEREGGRASELGGSEGVVAVERTRPGFTVVEAVSRHQDPVKVVRGACVRRRRREEEHEARSGGELYCTTWASSFLALSALPFSLLAYELENTSLQPFARARRPSVVAQNTSCRNVNEILLPLHVRFSRGTSCFQCCCIAPCMTRSEPDASVERCAYRSSG